jgi:hypothetical protein
LNSRGVKIAAFKIKDVSIPNTFYNIVTGVNDRFDLDIGAGLQIRFMPAGSYNVEEIVDYINTIAGATILEYRRNLNRIAWVGHISFVLNIQSTISRSVGLTLGSTYANTYFGTTPIVFEFEPRLMPFNIRLEIKELPGPQNVHNAYHRTGPTATKGFVIPVNVNLGEQIEYFDDDEQMVQCYGGKPWFIQKLTCQLVDNDTDQLLYMQDDWSVTFEIRFEDEVK